MVMKSSAQRMKIQYEPIRPHFKVADTIEDYYENLMKQGTPKKGSEEQVNRK